MQGFEFFVGLERFLQSLTSPKTIRLIINPVNLMNQNMVLKWSSFHPHAATLELLRVHYDWTQSTATSTEQDTSDFRQLFETTSRLEQLAISGIEIDDDGKQYEFLNFLNYLHPLRSLKILKLSLYSKIAYGYHAEYSPTLTIRAFELGRLVQRSADKIFSTLAASCPQFVALVIKARCAPECLQSEMQTYAFLRSKQTDLYGHTSVVGKAVDLHMVKHYEPCAEILEPERFPFD